MRLVVTAVFGLAVAGSILAGDGVVLVPHTHGPGTPLGHPHGLALYRFPIALIGAPLDAPPAAAQSDRPSFRPAQLVGETVAGASLIVAAALVVIVAIPALGRAARVALRNARVAAQWSVPASTGPPRPALLSV